MREKSQEKKDNILSTTLGLIAEQGFHGTSISQIAEKADVNVGSIYYHFTNKEDILYALYIDCKNRTTEYAFKNYSEEMQPEQNLKSMLQNIVSFFIENERINSYVVQFENSPYFDSVKATDGYMSVMKPYKKIYEQLNKKGLLKDLPINIIYSLSAGAITSFISYCLNQENIVSEQDIITVINAIWDMIKK